MRGVERSLNGVESASRSAHLSTGRLGNQFANLAGRIAGVHPVVGNLAGVLGNFAVGAGLTVGILGGVAAIAVAYDKLTESSRKAMAAADKLTESYNQAAKISALGIGGQQLADIETINKGLEQHNKWLGFIIAARIRLGSLGGLLGKDPGGHGAAITAGTSAAAAAEQARVNAIGLREAKNNQAWADRIKKEGEPAREAARKAAADALQASETYWRGQAALWKSARDRVAQLNEDARQFLLDNPVSGIVKQAIMGNIPAVDMPSVGVNDSVTKAQIKAAERMGILIDRSDANAEQLSQAIWGSSMQLANTLVSALNIGGGGRGSGLGGAVGGTAGSVGGMILGAKIGTIGGAPGIMVGAAIGGLIGTIGGSLLGGLFDSNKKAVNANTLATERNTQALLLNAPAGYRVDRHGYGSAAALYEAVAEEAMRRRGRGGVQVLGMAT